MRLLLIENPQRLAFIDKMLITLIPDQQRRLIACNAIINADPTPQKKLAQWIGRLAIKGLVSVNGALKATENTQIRLPEDARRVQEVLKAFEKSKPRIPVGQRDLNSHADFYSLEDAVTKAVDTGQVDSGGIVRRVPGAEIIYDESPFVVYMVDRISPSEDGKYSPEDRVRIKAVETLGMGPPETKWCTRAAWAEEGNAVKYLKSAPVFVIYMDGKPFIQKCLNQIKDIHNHNTALPVHLEEVIDTALVKRLADLKIKMVDVIKKLEAEGTTAIVLSDRVIKCDKVVDAGRFGDYYYVGIGKLGTEYTSGKQARQHWMYKRWNNAKLAYLRKNGIAIGKRYPNYPKGRIVDFIDYADGKRMEELVEDSSSAIIGTWLYSTILTINKKNVIRIIGQTR